MDHTSVRVFDSFLHQAQGGGIPYGLLPRISAGSARLAYFVDSGKVVEGAISENSLPAANTRVALVNARTMVPADIQRALGPTYKFRNVQDADLGYFVLGIDLDGVFRPVCEGPVFPTVSP